MRRALTCPWTYVLSVAYSCMNCTLGRCAHFPSPLLWRDRTDDAGAKACRASCRRSSSRSGTRTRTRSSSPCRPCVPAVPFAVTDGASAQYAVALVFMTGMSTLSDRARSRGPFVAVVFALSALGWLILLVVEHNQRARYFATFLTVIGGISPPPHPSARR